MIGRMLLGVAALLAACAGPPRAPTLAIVAVDVEGGAATLFVTPGRHALLIDTGWPAAMGPGPSSAARIAAATRAAGVTRIDDLIVTHYHVDHVGGVRDLLRLIPVGAILDHGPNRESAPADASPARLATAPATLYPAYLAAIAGHPHRVLRPGDRLLLDGLEVTVVDSDGATLAQPLPGGGRVGAGCAAAPPAVQDDNDENTRSVGVVARWGAARILALGDTMSAVEQRLACPRDLIGPVDLMFATHHGSALSNNPALVNDVRPRVAVVANGPVKGGDAAVLDALRASGRLRALWQLHYATRSPAANSPPDRIANRPGDADGAPIRVTVARDGAMTVVNDRDHHEESYAVMPR